MNDFLGDLPSVRDLVYEDGPLPLPRRDTLNIRGTGITLTDNPALGETVLVIPILPAGTTFTPPAIAAQKNDYLVGLTDNPDNVDLSIVSLQRWSAAATYLMTGLSAACRSHFVIANVGTFILTLVHQSSSSASANRFVCPGHVNYELPGGNSVEVVRDSSSSRWRVVK